MKLNELYSDVTIPAFNADIATDGFCCMCGLNFLHTPEQRVLRLRYGSTQALIGNTSCVMMSVTSSSLDYNIVCGPCAAKNRRAAFVLAHQGFNVRQFSF
jgi:hypothetical protein